SFSVSWSSVSVFDLDYYKIYYDSSPPYDFSHSTTTAVFAPATTDVITGLSTGTYIFKVTAVDRGAPRYPGVALESVAASSVTVQLVIAVHPPQSPYGIALTSGPAAATLSWMPVVRYADLTPFAVSTAPAVGELYGYSVFRATTPTLGVWNDMADVSTQTLTWTDLASGPQYYYYVAAVNNSGSSAPSVIRTPGTKAAYIVAPDDRSFYQVNAPEISPIEGVPSNPDSAYLISVSSRPQDLGGLNGAVVKSLEFDAYMGGKLLSPTLALSQPGLLSMHYDVTASSQVSPSGVSNTPSNMSVYWFNGVEWVQLYGTLDPLTQTMSVQTEFFGRFELRTVERATGFSFNMAGVSNRFITPNNDQRNDNVVFTFSNPNNSPITAQIFDARGRVVAGSLPPGPEGAGNSLMWDGTSGGRSVPGGVYIYQIRAEGQTYSGTLVIIK
ncbi:MAG TPA: gliding motility-associated C-terminal domain-containing protein, partial [Elusimicrobiota bacterium]|nr:gliding motility-associated C-terminal domain-containing protein [Elusimicrobiota bacterium]